MRVMHTGHPASLEPPSSAMAVSKALPVRLPVGLYLMLAWMLMAFLALSAVLAVAKMRADKGRVKTPSVVASGSRQALRAGSAGFSLLSLEEPVASAEAASAELPLDDLDTVGTAGRADPFAPLVLPPGSEALESADVARDPYQDVAFTGVIRNKTDAVAILRIRGSAAKIARPGTVFDLDGMRVLVKRIESGRVWLQGPDGLRAIALESFVDRVNTATQDAAADTFDKLAEPDDKSESGKDADDKDGDGKHSPT